MTEKQKRYRLELLAKIHVHPIHAILSDMGDWREWLYASFGVRSSAKLSISELKATLDMMKPNAEQIYKTKEDMRGRRTVEAAKYPSRATPAQIDAIEAERESLGWSPADLRGFVHRQTGKTYINITTMSKAEATKTLTGIRKVAEVKDDMPQMRARKDTGNRGDEKHKKQEIS